LRAESAFQRFSLSSTFSILSADIVFFANSRKSLNSFFVSSFFFFSSAVSFLSSISFAVMGFNEAHLYSVSAFTIHASIGSVKKSTSTLFSLNCDKYGLAVTSDSVFPVI
jgi:hypothetical protein